MRSSWPRQLDRSYEGLSDEWRPPKGSNKHRRATRARGHVKAADRLVQQLEAAGRRGARAAADAWRSRTCPSLPRRASTGADLDRPLDPAADRAAAHAGPLLEIRAPRASRGRLDLPGRRIDIGACGRLLVVGPNGSGKSTLLAAMAGTVDLDRGTRTLAPGVRLGVLAQEGPAEHVAEPTTTAFDAYARHALAPAGVRHRSTRTSWSRSRRSGC